MHNGELIKKSLVMRVTGWSWVELEEEGGVGGVAACSNGRQQHYIVEVTHQLVRGHVMGRQQC